MQHNWVVVVLACVLAAGCDGGEAEAAMASGRNSAVVPGPDRTCEVIQANAPLPREVNETSGLARSARDPDLFWTHNDAGNEPMLYGIDAAGRLVRSVRVTAAELVDWEDVEVASCGDRSCLYVGDIGDNDGVRERLTIYRVPEPAAGAAESELARALHARLPDGPRDAEGLFVDDAGDVFVVTKGRRAAIAIYRYPAPQRVDAVVTLEHVRDLLPEPGDHRDLVTAATATPDRRHVGIRTYRTLYLYSTAALVGGAAVQPAIFDLSALGEAQGESLALADDGAVWVTSEADGDAKEPRWSRLQCSFGS